MNNMEYAIVGSIVAVLLILNIALLVQLSETSRTLDRTTKMENVCVSKLDEYLTDKITWRQNYFECTDNFRAAIRALSTKCVQQECPKCDIIEHYRFYSPNNFTYPIFRFRMPDNYGMPNNITYFNMTNNSWFSDGPIYYLDKTPNLIPVNRDIFGNPDEFMRWCHSPNGPCW